MDKYPKNSPTEENALDALRRLSDVKLISVAYDNDSDSFEQALAKLVLEERQHKANWREQLRFACISSAIGFITGTLTTLVCHYILDK